MYEPGPTKPPAKPQKSVTGQTRPASTARPVNNRPPLTQRVNTQSDESHASKECIICQREHAIEECEQFKQLSVKQRWDTIKEKNTCFKCLIRKHPKKFCRANRCEKCGYGHHNLLHADKPQKEEKTESVTNIGEWRATALLKIMPVSLNSENGEETQCYALLDDGATVSLIDSSLATNLAGPCVPLSLKTAGGYGVTDSTSRVVQVTVKGPNGQCHKVKCRTMANVNLPTQTVSASVISDNAHLRDLGCVEMRGAKPLLLLGQDNWELLVGQDIRRGRSGKPVASLTQLGWVIHGPFDKASTETVNCMTVSLPDLHNLVKAQFELEAIGISQDVRKHKDVERALDVLKSTSRRTPDGSQWEVGLLWKHINTQLPNNYNQARQRLYGIERRMRKDAMFADAYSKQINRLVDEGYARKVESDIDGSPVWYLPHFGVVNPNKPGKLRLVFDAAAMFNGTCLNDNLLSGPDMLNSLLGILLKFRIGPIAFSGDIADMFLRIKIRAEDQSAQLFLWRGTDQSREPDTYAMNSMIFGAVSSPTTPIYILNKNASEFVENHPEAVEAIRSKHYMDGYLDSVWTEEQASSLIEQVARIHASGGFIIRGWVTNSSELRDKLKIDMPEKVALEKGIGAVERTLGLIWHWVPSEVNPADKATRLCWPDNCAEWLSGPLFLRSSQEQWPACHDFEAAEADLERIQRVHTVAAPAVPLLDYERYSSWTRLQRVMARTLIFIGRCRKRRASTKLHAADLEEAHNCLVKLCQEDSFPNERAAILKGLPVPNSSNIKNLDPMITDDGLLRVRGRLSACEVLSFEEKHPIILDGRHPLSKKLVAHYHAMALHANHETVINNLREKYWLTKIRAAVKNVVANCQPCRISRAKPAPPKKGDLPLARLENTRRAFVHVGVDYFGPMEVAIGRRREKRWGVLFTCFTTRAVHLELAATLSADSAILALRRLIARRGQPAHLYSDQGTNFIGANTELRAALTEFNGQLRDDATNRGITWHFNPPAAPHMGGCWERLVKSVKSALRSTLRERAPREEVLYTLLTEAELIINSRPLSYVYDDHNQPVVLTPNHLLLGTASGSAPFAPSDIEDIDSRRQWRRVNALADMFWRRWLREYLPTLQRREKWANNMPNVRVSDVVVIVDNNKDRSAWTKGIIKAVYHGNDGIIRVVDVKTVNGVLRRPVAKIIVLPTDQDVKRLNPITGGGM